MVKKCISHCYSENFILTDVNRFFILLSVCSYVLEEHIESIFMPTELIYVDGEVIQGKIVGYINRMFAQSWLHKARNGDRVVPSQQELQFQIQP